MKKPSDKPPASRPRPESVYPREYGWQRISHEAQVIDNLKKLGAVELGPPKKTGF